MTKAIYQKNPGSDDDWIAEGGLDEGDLQQLGENGNIVGLELRSIGLLPHRPFRHLTKMRRLKYLQIVSCPISTADMADIATLTKLESLWIEGCPVEDAGVEKLSSHPKLGRVVLAKTRITDDALVHLATIPRLNWLWLDGTAITNRGLAHLKDATGVRTLAFRDTAVTDEGILLLAGMPKLSLSTGEVRGTAVTASGLDALFAAQRAARKSVTNLQRTAQKPSPAIPPADIEIAKAVLQDFFCAMNRWQVGYHDSIATRSPSESIGDEIWERCREDCRQIFRQYCTPKPRAYGRPETISIGGPADYSDDPAAGSIIHVETSSRQRIVIETKQNFGVGYRCQYVLLKKGVTWLIDSKKTWGAGWEWTIL